MQVRRIRSLLLLAGFRWIRMETVFDKTV